MEQERANWFRFAQLIIKIGGKVLRRFFLLECLTSNFKNYSCHWNSLVHNPLRIAYSCILFKNFELTLRNSTQSAADVLNNLLMSWRMPCTKACTLMEETNRLQQWLNDIEKASDANASDGVKDFLQTWSSQIQKTMKRLKPMNTLLRRWDAIFLNILFRSQVSLQTEIENHDVRLSNRIKELKSLNEPSGRDLQQIIRNFKSDLDTLKTNCTKVFQEFEDACCDLLAKWENEITGCIEDTQDCETLDKFLTEIREIFKNEKPKSLADCLCNTMYEELLTLYNIKEEETSRCNLASGISKLAKELREKIERSPSFKEIIFTDSIKKLVNSAKRLRLAKPQLSILKDISSSTGLEAVDNSLLIALLQKSKFVHSKVHNGDADPLDWDKSISADILRLRSYRDKIVGHATQAKISNNIFDTQWKEATLLFCRIAARCGNHFETNIRQEIDQMKFLPLEPGREFRLLQEIEKWCREDILAQLSITSTTSSLCLEMLNTIEKAPVDISITEKDPSVWQCRNCKTEFTTGQDFEKHMCVQDPRKFLCIDCKTEFTAEFMFLNHGCSKDPQRYKCVKCRMETTAENELLSHTCIQDPTVYVCRNCKHEFNSDSFSCHWCTRVDPMN